jgi:hypothetical protein
MTVNVLSKFIGANINLTFIKIKNLLINFCFEICQNPKKNRLYKQNKYILIDKEELIVQCSINVLIFNLTGLNFIFG